jgi:SulP family sulfate permease
MGGRPPAGEEERALPEPETALELAEMELFKNRKDETLADLEAGLEKRTYAAGEAVYSRGESGDAIYLIRRGSVKIFAPLGAGRVRHIATFGRGDFFGGLAFLDRRPHDNDAITATETEFYVLSLDQFNKLAEEHKRLAFTLLREIARSLALRLRHADTEIAMLHEY